jgi:hypothetical protein
MLNFARKITTFITVGFLVFTAETVAWMADNGNGTFTNLLFYEEFSDPE